MKTKTLMVLALTVSFATAYAQSEEQVLNSAPINVDGYLHEDKPVTDAELESLKSTVNKYKTENKLYKEKSKVLNKVTSEAEKIGENAEEKIMAQVEAKKAETKAMEKIKKAEAKLKCLLEENRASEDCAGFNTEEAKVEQQVQVQQAAPVVSTAEIAPVATDGAFESIKLLPYAGATSFNGEVEQLETELSAGLRLESNITTRFSMGIGFKFDQLKTNDFANGANYMTPNYYGMYGTKGREIQYRGMGLDIYGKFFITNGERFRPYLGAGIGYNRATLKYNDNDPFYDQMNAYNFGSEEYNTSFVNGQLMLGSEVMITKMFGLNIEAAYSTGLGDSLSSKSAKNGGTSPDQARLRDLGEEIINANALSIFAGAVVNF
ncbi:MAG: outer membrane beta-barrel protein [Bacteriovoracia bacterium]